jgi:hypothetical protein
MKLNRFRPGKEHLSNLCLGLSDRWARDLVGIGRFRMFLGAAVLELSVRIDALRFAGPTHSPRHPSEPWRQDAQFCYCK